MTNTRKSSTGAPLTSFEAPTAGLSAIGAGLVQVELAATGFAQVLAFLKNGVEESAAAMTATPRRAAKASSKIGDIAQYFTVSPTGQDAGLAVQRRRSPGRHASLGGAALAAAAAAPAVRFYENLGVALGTVDRAGFEGLRNDDRISDVHAAPRFSLVRPVTDVSAKRRAGATWGLQKMGIPEMWAAGFTGKGVLIGHLDTGVDASHPAFNGAITHFAEFDDLGAQVASATPSDSATHGTHTAGTIVGRAIGKAQFGVAPEAGLASAMVIEGGNTIARVLGGMNWAAGLGVRVISLSLGLRGFNPGFLQVIQVLRRRGILAVVAVGNEGPGTSRSPGNYAEVLSVGATDVLDTVADFSGSERFERAVDGLVPDIVAPGVAVLSCTPGNAFREMSGTSMATPHVAGLAALLFQARPTATPDQIERAIFDSCTLPAGLPADRANLGIPHGPTAFAKLTGSALPEVGPEEGTMSAAAPRPKPRPKAPATAGTRGRRSAKPSKGVKKKRR